MTLADLFQIAETGASDAERAADAAMAAHIHRASLLDLHRARKHAERWSSAATVATLTAEINRRLGAQYMAHRKAASASTDGALQTGHAAQAHRALVAYVELNGGTTDQAAAAIRAAK